MGEHLHAFADSNVTVSTADEEEHDEADDAPRDKLLEMVRDRTGHDFSTYKQNTIDRRITRRMSLHRIDDTKDYLVYLRRNPEEVDELFRDLLIGVTSFFRDPESFERLSGFLVQEYLPEYQGNTLRAWVPGCSTGEEAFSLAILLLEAIETLKLQISVTVFATDIDERAIAAARTGEFPRNIANDISAERLRRFFEEVDDTYRANKRLRGAVVFAVQNVTDDPPFSKLDIVSCRNLLIYLKPATQESVLSRINYGLRPGGVLFLGKSETVSPMSAPFETVDKVHRIYKTTRKAEAGQIEGATGYQGMRRKRTESARASAGQAAHPPRNKTKQAAEQCILESAPPAVIATKSGEALYFHGRTGRFFEPAPGVAGNNVLEMARSGLVFELSSALSRAALERAPQVRSRVTMKTDDHEVLVDLYVQPVDLEVCNEPCFLITLIERPEHPALPREDGGDYSDEAARRIRELQEELQSGKQDMQAIIEEYEATTEELKSSNEELESTNEELKSTNEELETSAEELQSINEEQSTLNSELEAKNEELGHVRDDMDNLLAGTRIATLFLDDELHIRRFTPAMRDIMGLRDTDVGRPVGELTVRVKYRELEADAESVLADLNTVEREIQARDDQWFQLRIVPYRTSERVIDGVVATFNDITQVKRSQRKAELGQALAETTVNTVEEPLLGLRLDFEIETANRAFLKTFGLSRNQTIGHSLLDLDAGAWDTPEFRKILEEVSRSGEEISDRTVEHEWSSIGRKRLHINVRLVVVPDSEERRILLAITRIDEGAAAQTAQRSESE
ncbi:MAG: PAS domain-containing protein [Spirochaeta sp.]|jgi:two-component system CheB/CheR fusion protein|nr:PAS domain-containing protein [Spirochaeta sp.]